MLSMAARHTNQPRKTHNAVVVDRVFSQLLRHSNPLSTMSRGIGADEPQGGFKHKIHLGGLSYTM